MPDEVGELLSAIEGKILFAGVGNVLRSDDGVGVYITTQAKSHGNILLLTVETSMENYIGKIISLDPDTLIIIDCMDLKSPPGTVRLIDLNKVKDHTFNTHNISLAKLSGFFKMPVFVLGIQPENLGFGEDLSYRVKSAADEIIRQINQSEVHYGSRVSV